MSDLPHQKLFVSDDGKQKLRITKSELKAGIDSGKYSEKTLAWTTGMTAWRPLSDPLWEKHGIMVEQEPPDLPPLSKSAKQDYITETNIHGSGVDQQRGKCKNDTISFSENNDYGTPRKPRCCLSCGKRLQKKPIKTFLGFRKSQCVKCKEWSKFPLSKFYLVFYWILIGPILFFQSFFTYIMLKKGFLFLPGWILFFAFLVTPFCLIRDRQIYKKCIGQLNHLRGDTHK